MLRLAADENFNNFNNDIVRGVLRRNPNVDIVRIQDAGLSGADDPTVLEWAAQTGRVLLTHDVATITRYAYERIRDGKPMPGVFEVGRGVPIGRAIGRHTAAVRVQSGWRVGRTGALPAAAVRSVVGGDTTLGRAAAPVSRTP